MAAQPPRLILASRSPRRRQLLAEAGYSFEVQAPSEAAECGVCSGETPSELVARLAYQKAADAADRLVMEKGTGTDQPPVGARRNGPTKLRSVPGASHKRCLSPFPVLVLGCDTVAECMGQILGKPSDRDHARAMLRLLSGREHRVLSGLCLLKVPGGEPRVRVAITTLQMDELTPEQLETYLATDQWEGKAGAFGYQDGLDWVHIVRGSQSNVVGLPMELLAEMIEELADAK